MQHNVAVVPDAPCLHWVPCSALRTAPRWATIIGAPHPDTLKQLQDFRPAPGFALIGEPIRARTTTLLDRNNFAPVPIRFGGGRRTITVT